MKKELTLVILAAGMGSRFGGLKQVEPIGPNGEFIIDYSIYDAIKAGFTKVVFVIKKENYAVFKKTIGKRIEDKIKTEYVFQDVKDVPIGIDLSISRNKPWGTGHALYATRNNVHENFAMIGADDFYGFQPFKLLADYLLNLEEDTKFVTVGYQVKNTLSKNGSVKRGLFEQKDGKVISFIESVVEEKDGKLIAAPLNGTIPYEIHDDMSVSMIMFGFTPKLLDYLKEETEKFFRNSKNLETEEFLLPTALENMIKNQLCEIKIMETTEKWYGVTYPQDLIEVQNAIKNLIKKGKYPYNLWKVEK